MGSYTPIQHLAILFLIFWVSAYGGVKLVLIDFWDHLQTLRELVLLLGAGISFLLVHIQMLKTSKQKGYINLLWLSLPVLVLWGIESLWRSPAWRPLVLSMVIMFILSSTWLKFQKERSS